MRFKPRFCHPFHNSTYFPSKQLKIAYNLDYGEI